MIVKSFTDDIKLIKNHENLILVRDNGFNVLGISPHWEGGGILKSILWNSLKKTEEEISSPTETEDINEPITVIDVYPHSKEKIVTLGPVSTMSILGSEGSADSANFNISTLVLLTTSLEQDQLFKLMTTALQARSEIICD